MKFGQYELLERVAVGGMAEVYRGRAAGAEGFEKWVAIKRILPEYARDERFISMMLTEARIHSALSHRNIVQIHDLGISEDGEYFIVLEYVEGHDLRAVMEAAKELGVQIPDSLALHVADELAQALQFAHELTDAEGQPLGIVHRDVSPSNVLISNSGEVKLSDFGIAKRRHDHSVVGSLKGNLAYMSPEQARRVQLDRRTDVFSLGAVLFEMLTGHKLREITDEVNGFREVASGVVRSARALRADLPDAYDALLSRALASNPADRFPDAATFGAAIRELARESATPVGPTDMKELLELLNPPRRARSPVERSKVIRLGPEFRALAGSMRGTRAHIPPDPTGAPPPSNLPPGVVPADDDAAGRGHEKTNGNGGAVWADRAVAALATATPAPRSASAPGSAPGSMARPFGASGTPGPKAQLSPPGAKPAAATPPPKATPPPAAPPGGPASTAGPAAPIKAAPPAAAAPPVRRFRLKSEIAAPAPPSDASGSGNPSDPQATPPPVSDGATPFGAPRSQGRSPGGPEPSAQQPMKGEIDARAARALESIPTPPPETARPSVVAVPVALSAAIDGSAAMESTPPPAQPLPAEAPAPPPAVPRFTMSPLPDAPRPKKGTGRLAKLVIFLLVALPAAAAVFHTQLVPLDVAVVWFKPAKLSVESSPSGAALTLDGRAYPQPTPTQIEVRRDRGDHVLELKRQGSLPIRTTVRFDRTVALAQSVSLPPEPPAAMPPTEAPPPAPEPAPAKTEAKPEAADAKGESKSDKKKSKKKKKKSHKKGAAGDSSGSESSDSGAAQDP